MIAKRRKQKYAQPVDVFAVGEGESAEGWAGKLEPGLAINAVLFAGRPMPYRRRGVIVLPAEPKWMFATGGFANHVARKHVPEDLLIAWVDGIPVEASMVFRCGAVAHRVFVNADHLPDEQLCEACLPVIPFVYRFYDDEGDLLYVGCTTQPDLRMKDHQQSSGWWSLAKSVTTETFDSHRQALAAESEAIRTEAPIFNRAGVNLRAVA